MKTIILENTDLITLYKHAHNTLKENETCSVVFNEKTKLYNPHPGRCVGESNNPTIYLGTQFETLSRTAINQIIRLLSNNPHTIKVVDIWYTEQGEKINPETKIEYALIKIY